MGVEESGRCLNLSYYCGFFLGGGGLRKTTYNLSQDGRLRVEIWTHLLLSWSSATFYMCVMWDAFKVFLCVMFSAYMFIGTAYLCLLKRMNCTVSSRVECFGVDHTVGKNLNVPQQFYSALIFSSVYPKKQNCWRELMIITHVILVPHRLFRWELGASEFFTCRVFVGVVIVSCNVATTVRILKQHNFMDLKFQVNNPMC
jgi:hypothetical protein